MGDMDSGNSGSMQSSSGGDEEYDSRAADSISSLFNNPMSNQLPPPRQQHHHGSAATMFDPLQNYHFDHPISQPPPPPPLPNPNTTAWSSKTQRSEPNIITQAHQPIYVPQAQPRGSHFTSSPSSPTTVPFRPVTENSTHVARNPKKRSRASRRTPTTVLTTDTTNFRAMVQEFTGIPAPPFASSSAIPFPRGRMDIFGAPSSIRSNPPLDYSQPPPNLLRPFAQKVQPPPPPFLSYSSSSSSSSSSLLLDSSMANGSASNLSYDQLGLYRPPFPKYPRPNSSIFGSKTQKSSLEIPSNDQSNLKLGVFDDFGLMSRHTHLSHNLVSPADGIAWRTDSFPANTTRGVGSSNGDDHEDHHLRSVNGDFDFSRIFCGEKGQNSNSARGQGMVEPPWGCSSD